MWVWNSPRDWHLDGVSRHVMRMESFQSKSPIKMIHYDTNYTLGGVHDICPESLTVAPVARAAVQLASVLTLSNEDSSASERSKESVVARAMKVYNDAKHIAPTRLLDEHHRCWASIWDRRHRAVYIGPTYSGPLSGTTIQRPALDTAVSGLYTRPPGNDSFTGSAVLSAAGTSSVNIGAVAVM